MNMIKGIPSEYLNLENPAVKAAYASNLLAGLDFATCEEQDVTWEAQEEADLNTAFMNKVDASGGRYELQFVYDSEGNLSQIIAHKVIN